VPASLKTQSTPRKTLSSACPAVPRLPRSSGRWYWGGSTQKNPLRPLRLVYPSSIPEGYLTGVQKTKTKRAISTPSPFSPQGSKMDQTGGISIRGARIS